MPNDRESESRSTQERKLEWKPPEVLTSPVPREGMQHRWVRREVMGKDDTKNVISRARQHYTPVSAKDHPDFMSHEVEEGKHAGTIQSGDLMLMEVPEYIAAQRTAHYDGLAEMLQEGVDNELNRLDSDEMPLTRKGSKSELEFGNPSKEVRFQENSDD